MGNGSVPSVRLVHPLRLRGRRVIELCTLRTSGTSNVTRRTKSGYSSVSSVRLVHLVSPGG